MLIKAKSNDIQKIMQIITDAKNYLKSQNLKQWNQADGYPTETDLLKDIENETCYLYVEDNNIIGTMSIIEKPDENYNEIIGSWLTNNSYASIHRIAIKNTHHYKNIGVKMLLEAEEIVKSKNIYSIKIDTHKIPIEIYEIYAGISTMASSGRFLTAPSFFTMTSCLLLVSYASAFTTSTINFP